MSDFKQYFTDRRWVLLGIVCLGALFILFKVIPWNVFIFDKPLKMTLSKSRAQIDSLTANRDVDFKQVCHINTVDFPIGLKLRHANMGNFGISRDFYIDIETDLEVLKETNYIFTVSSDDGFQLYLNGELVGEVPGVRATAETGMPVRLPAGKYYLKLCYYQGSGPLSLRATYSVMGSGERKLVGQSGSWMRFTRPAPGGEKRDLDYLPTALSNYNSR